MNKIRVRIERNGGNPVSAVTDDYELLDGLVIVAGETYDNILSELRKTIDIHTYGNPHVPLWVRNGDYEFDISLDQLE